MATATSPAKNSRASAKVGAWVVLRAPMTSPDGRKPGITVADHRTAGSPKPTPVRSKEVPPVRRRVATEGRRRGWSIAIITNLVNKVGRDLPRMGRNVDRRTAVSVITILRSSSVADQA